MAPNQFNQNDANHESTINMEQHPPSLEGDGILSSQKRPKKWTNYNLKRNFAKIFKIVKTVCQILILIYLFMCGIELLTSSFKLIGGKNINALTKRGTLNNPLIGLIVGVLVTIMVQSSSTSTAIFVSLVSSGVINIQQAIPIIMGSNVGTSVTNTFVSFTQVGDREMFRRAFAGATVHDMFNWLCVGSLLSLELISRSISGSKGLLEYTTGLTVNATYSGASSRSDEPSGLKGLITPLTTKIIQINPRILECWANDQSKDVTTIIERFCDDANSGYTIIKAIEEDNCPTRNPRGAIHCCFLFATSPLSDLEIGIILLITSLALLIICLIVLVKLLNKILQGPVQEIVKKYINSDIPCAPFLTGYVALFVGAIMTVIMQSSSIFTSLLTPLIGMGVVSIERCYPLTLGSNIGTTTTALLAAFTENSRNSIQIALVHLYFNVFGILIFYPLTFMRFPIPMCKFLGRITSKYRWFAIVYIVSMFIVFPCLLLMLSEAGSIAFWLVLGLIFFIGCMIFVINIIQRKQPSILPHFLRNWKFLPLAMRSLEPYDNLISTVFTCGKQSNKPSELSATSELKSVTPTSNIKAVSSLDSGIENIKEQPESL